MHLMYVIGDCMQYVLLLEPNMLSLDHASEQSSGIESHLLNSCLIR